VFLPRYPQVVIYRPARAACQQGKALLNTWKIHPGEQQKWENPLMGWTSTGDASAHQFNSTMYFDSKEAAMAFCDKHGWEFEVQEPQLMGKGASTIPGAGKAGVRPKSYGDNFSSARKGTPIWPHPGFGAEAKN
jgi:NADH dehydrogenase (ubiquinone) Fe-S protein 4